MYIKNKKISFFYKIFALIVCIFGQILTLGILDGKFKISQLLFYTNQSNILCLIYFAFASVILFKSLHTEDTGLIRPKYKGAVVMAITVTMLIYWFMLDGNMDSLGEDAFVDLNPLWPLTNYVVHLIVPLLTILDWVLFDPKGYFDKLDPLRWLVIPLFYWIFAIITAQTGYRFYGESRYAYFFIDPDIVGLKGVILYVIILCLGFTLLGYLILGLDKLLKKNYN